MTVLTEIASKLLDEVVEAGKEDDLAHEGWFCININPLKCRSCGKTVAYVEPNKYHLIIVWERNDEEWILKIAQRIKEMSLDPRIVKYYAYYGKCIPWKELTELYE